MIPHRDTALYERIYLAVQQISPGQVASYGDIAAVVGDIDARTVGYALANIPNGRTALIPWQRVVNREGAISTRGLAQRNLLEAEGVSFSSDDRVNMARHQWAGPSAAWAEANGFHTLPPRSERGEQLSMF